ncbi:MAG: ribonuclease P protein component [Thermoflexales bacterium]
MRALRRLSGRRDFARVREVGRRWHGTYLTLSAAPSHDQHAPTRVGFVTARKVGGAVQRNRARRLLREAVRALSAGLPNGWDLVLIAHPPIANRATHVANVQKELEWLLTQARIFRPDATPPSAEPSSSELASGSSSS